MSNPASPAPLHRPGPAETITVVCPDCGGEGIRTAERACRLTAEVPCVRCEKAGSITIYWASTSAEQGEDRFTHLVQVVDGEPGGEPADCLCRHDAIPADELVWGLCGRPCLDCLARYDRLGAAVERKVTKLTAEFDTKSLPLGS